MSKLNPQVFRDAAELIASKESTSYCCCALDLAKQDVDGPHLQYFTQQFEPATLRGIGGSSPWWGDECAKELKWDEQTEARILALLLCAEMCKR